MMDPDDFRACLISMGYDLVRAFSPGQNMTGSFFFFFRCFKIIQKYQDTKSTFSLRTYFSYNPPLFFFG